MIPIPPPSAIGLDARYGEWYPHQDRAFLWIADWLNGSSKVAGVCAPTGSGKSILAILAALVSGRRTVILTGTKALQDQYRDQFPGLITDLRGAQAYGCAIEPHTSAEDGVCKVGYYCKLKDSGECAYWDAIRKAGKSELVLTNYHCWLSHGRTGLLGQAGLLVLDEAHQAHDALCGFLAVELEEQDLIRARIVSPDTDIGPSMDRWRVWAGTVVSRVQERLEAVKAGVGTGRPPSRAQAKEMRMLARLHDSLITLRDSIGEWVVAERMGGWTITPLWPKDYTDRVLVRGTGKVLLLSAFLTPKTVEMLGFMRTEWLEVQSAFPLANRMVLHIPTARANHRMDEYEMGLWVARIDQIINGRKDRKGIIHTVSYKRRDQIMSMSSNSDIMVTHQARDVVQVVEMFKRAKPPVVLVSPILHTGWDFPGNDARYGIIAKVPYPDIRDPLTAARTKADKDWPGYHAMSVVVQAAGRGVRNMGDWWECYIVDDDWIWFWPRNRRFAPGWFRDAVGMSRTIPVARSL